MEPTLFQKSVISKLPNGKRINVLALSDYVISGTDVVFTFTHGGTYTYVAGSVDEANHVIEKIDEILNTGVSSGIIEIGVTSLTFTSFSLTFGTVLQFGTEWELLGTGFLIAGITDFKFDDGGGNVCPSLFSVDSDTTITGAIDGNPLGGSGPFPSGTYTLYYSIDSGSTWTTTGLTFVNP